MSFKIFTQGRGLAYLLGLGAIILAGMDKEAWKVFLVCSVSLFLIGMFVNQNKNKKRRK